MSSEILHARGESLQHELNPESVQKRGKLSVDAVSASYRNVEALKGVSFEVSPAEFLTILGPSGCGKSTLLNCIAGFVELTGGQIRLDDTRIDRLPPYRRDVSMVFQHHALFPHLTVAENVAYGLKARKVRSEERKQRVDWALSLVGITMFADRYPRQLSGGQQQRVGVARAIVVEPSLLLMDEPLSSLDAKLRKEVRGELRTLQERLGQSVVFVTHDQEEALALSDRIVLMSEGEIEHDGPPEEVFSKPRTVFAADFMGVENIFLGSATDPSTFVINDGPIIPIHPTNEPLTAVGVRADRVRLQEGSHTGRAPADTPANSRQVVWEGHVVSMRFAGDRFKYEIRVPRIKATIHCERPAAHDFRPSAGTSVRVTILSDDVLPLK